MKQSRIQKYWIPVVVIFLLGIVGYAIIGSGGRNRGGDNTITDAGSIASGSVFIVQAVDVADLTRSVIVTKSSQLTSASTITISAQAAGRVQRVGVDPGTPVIQGRQILLLADTTNTYGIALDRASVGLEGAQLQYEQSQVQLQRSVDDAQVAYEQAQQSYDTLVLQREQQLQQAALNLASTITTTDATLTTVQSQLFSLQSALQSLTINLRDHIDRVIGESVQYRSVADTYQSSLIARGRVEYNQARTDWDVLGDHIDLLDTIDTTSTGQVLVDTIDMLQDIVQTENDILLNLQTLYQLALPSAGFTSQLQSQLQAEVTAFLGQNQSQLSQLINYRDQVQKLIASNENGQTNADITKQQAQIQFDATKTQLDDALKKAELALRQATTARDFARKNQDIQLRLLQNAITSAEVSYQDAARNAAKLSIVAPLDGQIADILVDVGQEVSIGTPLVSFIGSVENEVRITVDQAQREALLVGDEVKVLYGGGTYTGSITSIGGVADTTLSYPVTISIPDTVSVIGGTVRVELPFVTSHPLLPLSAVRPRGRDRAAIALWDGEMVSIQEIQTGKTWGDMIEVMIDDIGLTGSIILTDITNYDSNIHTIEVENIPYTTEIE